VRLVHLGDKPTTARLAIPGRQVSNAWVCSTLEVNRSELGITADRVVCELMPRRLATVRIVASPDANRAE
jgi:hypothetical protein